MRDIKEYKELALESLDKVSIDVRDILAFEHYRNFKKLDEENQPKDFFIIEKRFGSFCYGWDANAQLIPSLTNAVLELCRRVEELGAENKRLHDKYDFQLLVKRDEQQQATIDKLMKALEKLVKTVPYNSIEPDYLLEARQCLAEVRGME